MVEVSAQQVAQEECEYTNEGMNAKLLICPVVGRTERKVVGILEAPEVALWNPGPVRATR